MVFPIMLRLANRKCLVVGAGRVAAPKAAGLLSHGAKVVVIAPKAAVWIQRKAQAGKLVWHPRSFLSRDIKGAFLVVAATDSTATNHAIFRACQSRGVLCNVVDDPEYCDFFYPAVVDRGPLQIAISTSGNSPVLASRLRQELERQFGAEWRPFVEHIGRLRQELQHTDIPQQQKREQLVELASQKAFQNFRRQRALTSRSGQ